jgi:hypothetical protein
LSIYSEQYIRRSSPTILSNLLSAILPRDLKLKINSFHATKQLSRGPFSFKALSVEQLLCMIDAGGTFENAQKFLASVMRAGNVKVFEALLDIGVGTQITSFPENTRNGIVRFLNKHY